MEKEFNIGKLTLTYDSDFLKKWYEHPQVYFEYESIRYKISFEKTSLGYAYYFKRGPTLIRYEGKNYTDADEDYEETLASFEKHLDINFNCFGYVLFESSFWYETNNLLFNRKEIQILLETMGYAKVEQPEPMSIAVFFKSDKASHIAKSDDGKLWSAKEATQVGITNKLLNEIIFDKTSSPANKIYSEVNFYKVVA